MARIDDFGAHLSGAAKERWSGYRDAMGRARREAGDPLVAPLSEAFPEPPYARLIEDGADPWVIAFVRAARELIPARPRDPHRGVTWARTVLALRDLAGDLIDGSVDRDRVTTLLSAPAYDRFRDGLEGRMNLYLTIGHEQSLRGLRIVRNAYRQRDGVRHDPPQVRWDVIRDRAGRAAETIISELSPETATTELRLRLSGEAARRPTRRAPIEIFSYRNRPERGAVIGVKTGAHLIELARFPDVGAARTHLRENRNGLERRLAELRDLPPERGEGNRERAGPSVRTGDVSADTFLSVFGFRGVQFGNYVEGPRRQADLNRAHDALLDLAGVLACARRALSLGGTLGLAFGARGRGGKGAAAAHYEPEQRVINLTKTNGAGSLAHEWFHALDNHLARASGGRTSQYASELDGPGGGADLTPGARDRDAGPGPAARPGEIRAVLRDRAGAGRPRFRGVRDRPARGARGRQRLPGQRVRRGGVRGGGRSSGPAPGRVPLPARDGAHPGPGRVSGAPRRASGPGPARHRPRPEPPTGPAGPVDLAHARRAPLRAPDRRAAGTGGAGTGRAGATPRPVRYARFRLVGQRGAQSQVSPVDGSCMTMSRVPTPSKVRFP